MKAKASMFTAEKADLVAWTSNAFRNYLVQDLSNEVEVQVLSAEGQGVQMTKRARKG